jgi:extracellular factor (EF) 3-hydroxypalmitic acid methyl ester biosynthesis protein
MVHSIHEMGKNFNGNGNGNGNGTHNLFLQPPEKRVQKRTAALPNAVKYTQVTFQTHEAVELRGTLVRTTRLASVFELYNPIVTPRVSEALEKFKIILQEQVIYSGRAVVHNVLDAGTKVVFEAALDESHWTGVDSGLLAMKHDGQIANEFKIFLGEWQKLYKVSAEFKVAIADMQTFLNDFRLWLDHLELGMQSQPAHKREEFEQKILEALREPAMIALVALFEKFERLVIEIEKDSLPAHSLYAKRALHPQVLCSPFMHRTFEKPLGYAGDYEMVNMMTRNPFEGGSLYAKILNSFFLKTAPVVAHCNRIDTLVTYLQTEVLRATKNGNRARVFNLGCGPAAEIQRFLRDVNWSDLTDFTLLDFNDETVAFARQTLGRIRTPNGRMAGLDVIKKSVAQLLKDGSKFKPGCYDLVYCAGLFDYLPDNVCKRLLEIFYELTAPGGLVLITNVDACNPSRGWMECVVDWFLVYRDANKMREIMPTKITGDTIRIFSEPSSVNIFAEIRKREHV